MYETLTISENSNGFYNSGNMNNEENRLKTFFHTTLNEVMQKELARVGFYYVKVDNAIKCEFCHIKIKIAHIEEDPIELHLKWNSSCAFIRRQQTKNIPINKSELDNVLPPPFRDVCGHGPEISMKHPKFRFKESRLTSFENWPQNSYMKPEILVDAGFYYLGKADQVVCYSCGTGIMGWEQNDCPFEEHARISKGCDHLNAMKGEHYITEIKAKYSGDMDSGFVDQ